MANIIGTITSQTGSFFIKHSDESITTAKVGDKIYVGEELMGSSSNSISDNTIVTLADGSSQSIEIIGNNNQVFDTSMLSTNPIENIEDESLLEEAMANTQDNNSIIDENQNLTLEEIENLPEAAAGADEPTTDGTGTLVGRLEDRTAQEVNVTTDLRDQTLTDQEVTANENITGPNILEEVVVPVTPAEPEPEPEPEPENNAPTSSDTSIMTSEDLSYVLKITDFGNYNDLDNDPLASIKITALPTNGVLEIEGTTVLINDEISILDITEGNLIFIPNENTDLDSSFTFQVSDGEDWSQNQTATINITAVADAPDINISMSTSLNPGYSSEGGRNANQTESLTYEEALEAQNGNNHENDNLIFKNINQSTIDFGSDSSDKVLIVTGNVNGNKNNPTVIDMGDGGDNVLIFTNHTPDNNCNITFADNGKNVIVLPISSTQYDASNYNIQNVDGIYFLGDNNSIGDISSAIGIIPTQEYTISLETLLNDTDGSESLSIQLQDIPENAIVSSDNLTVTQDTQDNSIWNISIDPNDTDINGEISVNVPEGTDISSMKITATSAEDNDNSIFDITLSDNLETLILDTDDSIDLSSTNIESVENIDLSAVDTQEIKNISLDDVVANSDDNNILKITGDNLDNVTLTNDFTKQATTETIDNVEFDVYIATDNLDTYKVLIETDINDNIS